MLEIDAGEGKTIAKGTSLDADMVERQTKATVAAGGDATARIQTADGVKAHTIAVKENPLVVEGADVDTLEQVKDAHDCIVERYEEVRGANDEAND